MSRRQMVIMAVGVTVVMLLMCVGYDCYWNYRDASVNTRGGAWRVLLRNAVQYGNGIIILVGVMCAFCMRRAWRE